LWAKFKSESPHYAGFLLGYGDGLPTGYSILPPFSRMNFTAPG
jgi:hypothetical protein